MNILVFSSSMPDNDFAIYQENAKIKPNPSNQNFYSKLIRALSISNNVSVVSHRPMSKGMNYEKKLERELTNWNNIKYYYTEIAESFSYKVFNEQREIKKTAIEAIEDFHSNDFIIIVDPLRLSLLLAAKSIAKKYNVKIVGMLTDNPKNLTNAKSKIASLIIKLASSLDGYLSLTNSLVEVYNKYLPSYVFPGLVSNETSGIKKPLYDYYFFAGSLYERYGVKTLVDAFHESNIKNKLIIAGKGPLADYISKLSYDDYRIFYVSQITKERVIGYMNDAIANINPRPLDEALDKESVPSKMFEYLSVNTPLISTEYPLFTGTFRDDIYWIKGNTKEDIIDALNRFNESPSLDRKKKASSAKLKAYEFYSLRVQAESITHFLTQLNSSSIK